MTDLDPLASAVAKIDQALQQIETLLKERPDNEALKIAKASLESAKMDLTGEKAR